MNIFHLLRIDVNFLKTLEKSQIQQVHKMFMQNQPVREQNEAVGLADNLRATVDNSCLVCQCHVTCIKVQNKTERFHREIFPTQLNSYPITVFFIIT